MYRCMHIAINYLCLLQLRSASSRLEGPPYILFEIDRVLSKPCSRNLDASIYPQNGPCESPLLLLYLAIDPINT